MFKFILSFLKLVENLFDFSKAEIDYVTGFLNILLYFSDTYQFSSSFHEHSPTTLCHTQQGIRKTEDEVHIPFESEELRVK